MNKSGIINKWKRWVENDLRAEIEYLLELKAIYTTLGKNFKNSGKFPEKNILYRYLGMVHSAAISTGIYRLIDVGPDVVSLVSLLNEVKNNPQLISRRTYTHLNLNNMNNFVRKYEEG